MSSFKMIISDILKKNGIFVILIALCIVLGISSPVFFTVKNLLIVARQISMVTIASVGMMFVILSGGIDLSIGSIVSLSNVLIAYLMVAMGMNPLFACVLVTLIMLGVGAIQGAIIAKIRVPALIVTLAFLEILKGIAFTVCEGFPISKFPESFLFIGQGTVGIIPVPVLIMIGVVFIGWFILNKTYFGRYFYAIGGNEEASLLSGIKVDNTKILIYMLSAFFATIAGIVMLARLNTGMATNGSGFEFEVIIAVVLGGVSVSGGSGRIAGVVAGALIVGILSNGMTLLNFGAYVQMIVKGIVLIAAVSFDCIQKNREIAQNKRKGLESLQE